MKISKVLVVYMPGFNEVVSSVRAILKKSDIKNKSINRDGLKKNLGKFDLVITIGGDGTFLRTSHYILDDTPMVGINPNPKQKEGFFCLMDKSDYKKKLLKILEGNFKPIKLSRLTATINNKAVPDLALNEFYFGRATGYHMSKYTLLVGGKKETQKSSGVLVGTPQSSHSWIGSAGGKILPLARKCLQYVVREPYHGTLSKQNLVQGILSSGKTITLKPLTKDFILVVDSLKEIKLTSKDIVKISISKKVLNYVSF